MPPISDLAHLLRSLQPVLNPGVYAFCVIADDDQLRTLRPLATFREAEGMTAIVEASVAQAHGLAAIFEAAWITLTVNSDLQAVGLTAAVARALADAGISCNVVAAVHHDHLFVPVADGPRALEVLQRLQAATLS
jgi:hypothetical protein